MSPILPRAVLFLAVACQAPVAEPPVTPAEDPGTLEMEAIGPTEAEVNAVADRLHEQATLAGWIDGHRARQLAFEVMPEVGPDGGLQPGRTFRSTWYDYDANRAVIVEGSLDAPGELTLTPTTAQLAPTPEEFEEATRLALEDPATAEAYERGEVEFFQAMPPVVPNDAGDRTICVGIRPTDTTERGEIAGANLSEGQIVHYAGGTPPTSRVGGFVCNPPPTAAQGGPGRGTAGWARLVYRRNGQEVWSLTVRRPASSAGTWGSGVELMNVRYRGKRVLQQAGVPILNVEYENNACGPYRDWQYQENPFEVGPVISSPAAGISVVQWAKTIRELRDDTGNYSGVAAFYDGLRQEIVVMSELEAGWYRYVSEWRFGMDGTITPRFGFDAVQNWCTCQAHTHHVYWRLDLELGNGNNTFQQDDGNGTWTTLSTEAQRERDDVAGRRWRVTDPASGDGVLILPRSGEDPADVYGIADAWFVTDKPTEYDDANVPGPGLPAQAGIGAFVDGENLVNADGVLWYGAHFLHDDSNPQTNQTHTVSLRLVPEAGW